MKPAFLRLLAYLSCAWAVVESWFPDDVSLNDGGWLLAGIFWAVLNMPTP